MPDNPGVTVETTHLYYVTDAELQGTEHYYQFAICVQPRGDEWVVRHEGEYLGADGRWSRHPQGFDHDTALALAEEWAPHVVADGKTIGDVLA